MSFDSSSKLTVFPLTPKARQADVFVVDIPCLLRHDDGNFSSGHLQVHGFQPRMYLELDPKFPWNQYKVNEIVEEMQRKMPYAAPSYGRYIMRKSLQGYKAEPDLHLIEVSFHSMKALYGLRKRMREAAKDLELFRQMKLLLEEGKGQEAQAIRQQINEQEVIVWLTWRLTCKFYEDDIDMILKMLTDRKLSFSQFFYCQGNAVPKQHWVSFGNVQHQEFYVHYQSMLPVPLELAEQWSVPVTVLSFDIEANSDEDNRMPCPYYYNECAYLNTCIFQRIDKPESLEIHAITLLPCPPIENVVIHQVPNEVEMIKRMAQLIQEKQPDVITGYNISAFDIEFLHVRLTLALGRALWPTLGRMKDEDHSELEEVSWSSSGATDIKGKLWKITGREIIDTYMFVLRGPVRFTNYKLDSVAEYFLKEKKHPIKPTEQFAIFKGYVQALKSGQDLQKWEAEYVRMVKYCVQDSLLVMKLFTKLMIWENQKAKSMVFQVPVPWILNKGETVKTIAMLYPLAVERGYVMTPIEKQDYDFEGGLVQDPVQGLFRRIICLDFTSLYPSCMMQMNACSTTHVMMQPEYVNGEAVGPKEVNGLKVNSVIVKEKIGTGINAVGFVDKSICEGLAPMKLRQLISARGEYKKKLKQWTDISGVLNPPPEFKVLAMTYDIMQNQLKIAANATYGFFGASFNKYAYIWVAMATTARGRELITFVANYLKEKYSGRILYGDTDSVMFDMLLKLGKECHEMGAKLAAELTKMFPPPISIAYEKSGDFLFMEKKHYAAYLYDKDGNLNAKKSKMTTKGIAPARRDYCEWVKEFSLDTLHLMLTGSTLKECMRLIQQEMYKCLKGEIPIKQLTLVRRYSSKSAGSDYAIMGKFANKKRRDPIRPRRYEVGTRIEYCFILREGSAALDFMEDVEDLQPTDQLYYMYYLEHQFMNPMEKFLRSAYKEQIEALSASGFCYQPLNNRCQPVYFSDPVWMLIRMLKDRNFYLEQVVESIMTIPELQALLGQQRGLITTSP